VYILLVCYLIILALVRSNLYYKIVTAGLCSEEVRFDIRPDFTVKFFFHQFFSAHLPFPSPRKASTWVRLWLGNSRIVSHHIKFIIHELPCHPMLYGLNHCPWRTALLNTHSKLIILHSVHMFRVRLPYGQKHPRDSGVNVVKHTQRRSLSA
jgi:hypothetical protein